VDRRRDVAIDFPEGSILARNADDAAHLDLTLSVYGNAVIRLKPDYFTRTLHVPYYVPFDDSYFKTAPMVWSSWTSYYEAVREQDIVRNTDWLAANLKEYFWNQKEIGTWKGTLEVPIEPHDTRVLFSGYCAVSRTLWLMIPIRSGSTCRWAMAWLTLMPRPA
jgi:hypothetical protein